MGAVIEKTSLLCDAALALVYPQSCNVCSGAVESRFDGVVCRQCWDETRLCGNDARLCWKCGVIIGHAATSNGRENINCHRCADGAYSAARACGIYEGALRASIIALKRRPYVSRRLEVLMEEQCRQPPLDGATLILPVPLHPERERQRGFNQAAVLAQVISKLLCLPVAEHVLARAVHTERHRAGMDARSRHESVENAFTVLSPRIVEGEKVLLVDDVLTTGATVSACALALRAAGAEEVLVLTLARPLHP